MTAHIDRASLLAYAEENPTVDRERIAAHLAQCDACRRELRELQELMTLLTDATVHELADRPRVDPEREGGKRELLAARGSQQDDDRRADAFMTELLSRPADEWLALVERRPEEATERLVRRIIRDVEIELNRNARRALQMLDVAEAVAVVLDDEQATYRSLGDCYKHRANAQRHLGEYPACLEAAERATALYRLVRHGEFDVGQALYTRAATLFKMTRFADALVVLTEAVDVLRPFGDSMPFAKTLMLNAAIRFDEGDTVRAERTWRAVAPMLERFGEQHELALVQENLAECTFRLGRPVDALAQAEAAAASFQVLGIDADRIRCEWTVAAIRLVLGYEDALDGLHAAAQAFEERGMLTDAGFVKLDITEELLKRKDWQRAAATARELAILFTKARVTLASVLALSYLAEAVEGERATPALVDYVRRYVAADDPHCTFAPPHEHAQ